MATPIPISDLTIVWRDKIKSCLSDSRTHLNCKVMLWNVSGLFNLRATDIRNTPVFYAYALYSMEKGLHLFLHDGRETEALKEHFKSEGVEEVKVLKYLEVAKELKKFVSSRASIFPRSLHATCLKRAK